jgi:hypothetical protein
MKSAGQASHLKVEQNEALFLESSLDLYSALELSCTGITRRMQDGMDMGPA